MPSEMDTSPYIDKFEEFYSIEPTGRIDKLLAEYPVQKSLLLDYLELEKFDRELADLLVKQPDVLLGAAERALLNSQEMTFKTAHPDVPFEPHVRIITLPESVYLIQDISSKNI